MMFYTLQGKSCDVMTIILTSVMETYAGIQGFQGIMQDLLYRGIDQFMVSILFSGQKHCKLVYDIVQCNNAA